MTPLEPDFAKHLMNVLTDLEAGQLDGVEEAFEAIMTHPGAAALTFVPVFNFRAEPGSEPD